MIKMTDIARELGVSSATVSLAVNNKPGVSEDTRKRILKKIQEFQETENKFSLSERKSMKVLKVIVINHNINTVYDPEMDLWTDTLHMLDTETGNKGYSFSISYLSDNFDERERLLNECYQDYVAGVLLFATEAREEDRDFYRKIDKPVVLYDYEDIEGERSSVCINPRLTLYYAFNYLKNRGLSDIRYFSTGKEIYNFNKRREAFLLERNRSLLPDTENMISLGNSVKEISKNARCYFEQHDLPEAMIFENYQVSMGVISTLSHLRKGILGETSLVGIDEIPAYVYQNNAMDFSFVRIPHANRAKVAVDLLVDEIEGRQNSKLHIEVSPEFVINDNDNIYL